ncbi:MAG: hypothetical protein RLZZ245_3618 [Verrucomicrobiota bacterium]
MAIPDYQTCMLPFLRYLSDRAEHTLRDAEESLAEHFKLTPAERAELLPSGQQGIFKNRIGWARMYLKKAALLESPRRAVFKITERGMRTLASNPRRRFARPACEEGRLHHDVKLHSGRHRLRDPYRYEGRPH